jgi:hypothetical protein
MPLQSGPFGLDRRRNAMPRLFRLAVVFGVAVGVALAGVPLGADVARSCTGDRATLAGTWTVKVTFEGVFKIKYMQTFNADGRTTLLLPFGGPVNADDTRVGCMGEWRPVPSRRHRHPHAFDMTMKCLYSQDWDFPAWALIKGKVTLAPDGKTFTADFTYGDYDEGGSQLFEGTGVIEAERLVIQPLE